MIIVTGAGGVVGSACCTVFKEAHYRVLGIDNDTRGKLFGANGSVQPVIQALKEEGFDIRNVDLREERAVLEVFREAAKEEVTAVVHCAGQPSHDWSAQAPIVDFALNAGVTLALLEYTRMLFPSAAFVYLSTNKVYGDLVNRLPFTEFSTRYDLPKIHFAYNGIPEIMAIDRSRHSIFGVSKAAADLMVQEYGRRFGMNTVCFRCGCITGALHRGVQLHGFLSYLVRAVQSGTPYTIFGYKGKQVRDNIHALDLAQAILEYLRNPTPAAVYNMGGGRENSISVLEALGLAEKVTGKRAKYTVSPEVRYGDHKWWISDTSAFQRRYPSWSIRWTLQDIFEEMVSETE